MIRPLRMSFVALSLALAACSGSTSQTETSTASASGSTAAAMTTAPVAPQTTGHLKAMADALSTVPLRADQRTQIEQLAADANTRRAAGRAAHVQLAEAVAAQIEAGALDRAALQPQIDATTAAMTTSRPADRAAFEQLHALLTPDQRAQFVDALEASREARGVRHGGMHGRMQEWATDLKLTEAQQDQIKDILKTQLFAHRHDLGAMREHGHELLDSFKSDTLAPAPAGADVQAKATMMVDSFFTLAGQILPVLTPQQRGLAAAKIRARVQADDEGAPFAE